MRNKVFQLLTICFILTGLLGCGGISQSEYNALKVENEKLKKEIEDLKFGPDKLLNQAKYYLDSKDFYNAKIELQALLEKHSGSQQATDAKSLLEIVNKGINEQKVAEEKANIGKEKAEKDRLANATKKMIKKCVGFPFLVHFKSRQFFSS